MEMGEMEIEKKVKGALACAICVDGCVNGTTRGLRVSGTPYSVGSVGFEESRIRCWAERFQEPRKYHHPG